MNFDRLSKYVTVSQRGYPRSVSTSHRGKFKIKDRIRARARREIFTNPSFNFVVFLW